MRKKYFLLFFSMICCLCSTSQNIKFEHYDHNSGLSNNSVRHIVQDKEGFLWLGTFAGLNRFDGYQFKPYLSSSSKDNTIYNDDITALELDDASNNLWIGTRKGLTLFKTDSYTFTTFLPEKNNPNSLPDEEIRAVYVDKFKRVWVGTKTKGVYMFYPKENRFEKVNIKGFEYVKEIFEDKNGHIWVGSYGTGSVAKISLDKKGAVAQLQTYTLNINNSKDKNPYINFIYEDAKSDIFVGTREGLYKLDKENNIFKNLYIEDDTIRENLGPYFLSVARSPEGKYWVGTLGGLLVCDNLEAIATGDFKRHYAVLSNDTSLKDNLVSALYFDPAGILWIGTGDGLDRYDPYQNQFKLNKDISTYIDNQAPRVRGFSETYDKKVIIATRHNGLFITEKEEIVPLFHEQYDIASIFSDDGKIFYCGLWSGKILVYNYLSNSAKLIDVGFEKSAVLTFLKLEAHKIMVGSFGEGAIVLNSKSLQKEASFGRILEGSSINKIVFGSQAKSIWFATEDGVAQYLLNSKKITKHNATANKKFLPHNNVSDVIVDASGNLWAATRLGLARYDALQNNFKAMTAPEELAGKWISDMVLDSNGDLWLNMNNNSIAKYNTTTNKTNIYYVNSGYRLDVFSSSGFYHFNNSQIYLGSKNGVIYFSPYTIKENYWSPTPFITEFKVQNKEVYSGMEINNQKFLPKNLNFDKNIELDYDNRNFSIQFSSPSFSNERLNKFEYMLLGFDEDWISTNSNSRTIQYTNLYPNDYVFKMRSSNSNGYLSDAVSYKIKISPPFWLTYKALFLAVLILALVFYLVRRTIKDRIVLRQQLLTEKLKQERNEKLNNEKLRFFTNISHELRTPLTLILGPAEQLIKEGEKAGNNYQQTKSTLIYQNAKRLLNLVNQILDFRKAQTGALKLKVSKTDILLHSKTVFETFKDLAKDKNISFNFISENNSIEGWIDNDKYDKILYNLLSNAIKFTNKQGSVDIFISLKNENKNRLLLEVSDTGIGIPFRSQKNIFKRFYQTSSSKENNTGSGIGLSLVKSLIELHKGTISFKSSPGKGTIFTIEIPINRTNYTKEEVFEFSTAVIEPELLKVKPTKKILQTTGLKQKILVVEDNAELRNYLVDYLSDYYKVYKAENGEEGLKICKRIKPVVCVADVMMPIMDGLEFCEALKKDEFISHIPVILLTALSENEDKVRGYGVGADGYLVKPFDPNLLRTRIVNIINSRVELKTKFSGEIESEISLLTHSPVDEVFMDKVTLLINENLAKTDLTTTFLCNDLGMSSSNLYRKIKELTDLAPNEFIRTIRLKKAAQLLKTKKHNVTEVTYLVGFNDPLYFSRCFKKQFGFPPSKLIK
ncbi:hybrid sensor histidine kinase/response regulator transcription factor [Flavicella sediminum]|uniref:hybrid sensor histidine kinase/response regulator transcription factor n=1 Tax=Flavicella sediminum TaxID=2585141 RepID=UPI0011239DFC|nr:hybrid sensor histidine kinase/response regulator transcription factor [Flavicella sediminum]